MVLNQVALGQMFPFLVWTNVENCRDCMAVVFCTVSSGDMAKVMQSGITNYLCSWQNKGSPPCVHDSSLVAHLN